MTNEDKLDFAVFAQTRTKDWQLQLSHLLKVLLINQAFKDFNKQTAVAALAATFEDLKLAYDPHAMGNLVSRIARKRVRNVRTIRSMIKDVVR